MDKRNTIIWHSNQSRWLWAELHLLQHQTEGSYRLYMTIQNAVIEPGEEVQINGVTYNVNQTFNLPENKLKAEIKK